MFASNNGDKDSEQEGDEEEELRSGCYKEHANVGVQQELKDEGESGTAPQGIRAAAVSEIAQHATYSQSPTAE